MFRTFVAYTFDVSMSETLSDWYVIVNPHAGSGKTISEWPEAVRLLDAYSVQYTTVFTDRRKHAVNLASEAAAAGYRKILAVGGDGSVHEVFLGVLSWCEGTGVDPSEFLVGVLPIGSGNDWIKTLSVPKDKERIIEAMHDETFCYEDVVRVTAADGRLSYMSNVGGVGFDSSVCERVNKEKERGYRSRLIYVNALMGTIRTLKPINIGVRVDDEEVFNGCAYSVALGNGRYSGSGMCQVPQARIDDGLVDVMIVPKVGVMRIARELPRLFTETMDRSKAVKFARGRKIEIYPLDAESEAIFEVDGEIEGRIPMRIECTGAQLRVLKV